MRAFSLLSICLLSFILVSTISVNTASAASDRCPRHQVSTNLKGKLAKTKVFKGSTKSFTEYVTGHSRGGSRILGFVNQAEIYTKLKYDFEIIKASDKTYCVQLNGVKGYFYAAPKLFLPTDYKKSSCEYKQVLKHEKRHLQAVYDFHKKNTGKYSSYLGRIVRAIPIFKPVATQEELNEIETQIINYFENKFRELEYKSVIELNNRQSKIDSPQEYTGVSKRCSEW